MRRRKDARAERDLLAGTLDMLILRMLQAGPAHGLQIAQDIERRSDDVLLVEQGSPGFLRRGVSLTRTGGRASIS
jgi:hypothetical protein